MLRCATGATATTEGAPPESMIASASARVTGCGLVPWLLAMTYSRFVPMDSMLLVIDEDAPFPIASMEMTEATPMTMPSMVRPVRSLLALRLFNRICKKFKPVHFPLSRQANAPFGVRRLATRGSCVTRIRVTPFS